MTDWIQNALILLLLIGWMYHASILSTSLSNWKLQLKFNDMMLKLTEPKNDAPNKNIPSI